MAVLLAAAMLVAQIVPLDGAGDATDVLAQEATVETPVEAEATPESVQVPIRAVWLRVAQCESSGRWSINSGNGYYGGLQEDRQFWANYGNRAYARPDLAPMEEQVAAAERGLAVQGWQAWPRCSRLLGLR